MPGIETQIWLAIKGRIESLPAEIDSINGTDGEYPIAWPGELFSPTNEPYLRIGRATAAPAAVFIDDGKPHDRNGSLIITLVYPLSEKRMYELYDEIASTIAAHFQDGTQMRYNRVCVKVSSYPHVQPGYEDNGYWSVPVSIPWRCFA